jgi:glutamate 5-kinase
MYQRLVIKVGTNVLTRPDGQLDVTSISGLVDQIAELKRQGVELVLVSSGAVGAGRGMYKGLGEEESEVARRQVFSAIGQVRLMELYRQLFQGHGLLCAQVLATKSDFRDDRHRENMLGCLRALLQDRIVPVVNENDVVAVRELMFTDNDELAGMMAEMLGVDALVILSSVEGLYDGPPAATGSRLVSRITAGDGSAAGYVQESRSRGGRGGMATKLRIANETAAAGIPVLIGHGRRPGILREVGSVPWPGTTILPAQ